jgi:hypothetical protein
MVVIHQFIPLILPTECLGVFLNNPRLPPFDIIFKILLLLMGFEVIFVIEIIEIKSILIRIVLTLIFFTMKVLVDAFVGLVVEAGEEEIWKIA